MCKFIVMILLQTIVSEWSNDKKQREDNTSYIAFLAYFFTPLPMVTLKVSFKWITHKMITEYTVQFSIQMG